MKLKILLTKRDIRLLQLLGDYGILSSNQVARFLFGSVAKTTVLRRLRMLESNHYIRKRGTLPDGTGVYLLGEKGHKILGIPNEYLAFPFHQLKHEILLSEIRWQLESLGVVKAYLPEWKIKREIYQSKPNYQRQNLEVPDAMVEFQNFKLCKYPVHLELELHLKSKKRYTQKFLTQRLNFYKTGMKTWYFCGSLAMKTYLENLVKKESQTQKVEHVFFTVLSNFLEQGIHAETHFMGQSYPLWKVFGQESESVLPAQANAHGVSRETSSEKLLRIA